MAVPPSLGHIDTYADLFMNNKVETKTFKRRYWIIFLYSILSMLCSTTILLYTSVANQTGCYYGVSQNAVNWTTQIFPAVYLVFIVPGSFLMDYLDIRRTLILASFLQTCAALVQFFTLKPDNFIFVIISSFISALAGMFTLGLAPYIAARWFSSSEVSRACVIGMCGIQSGVGLGALFPPFLINQDCLMKDKIEEGKRNMAYIFTLVNMIVFIFIVFTFQNKPPKPPNAAKMKQEGMSMLQTSTTILKILKNCNSTWIIIVAGIMGGILYAFQTTANDLIIKFLPGKEVEISGMNAFCVCMGLVGSICVGYILDYTHKFKETTIVYCVMSLLFYLMFSGTLYLKKVWIQFVSVGLFGFFQGGFLPLGMEYGIEVVFPESEMISSNLQFMCIQLFGIIYIQIVSRLLDNFGEVYSNSSILVSLLICVVISLFLTTDYKRSKKLQEEQRNKCMSTHM